MKKAKILSGIEWHNIFNLCNDPMFLLDEHYNIIDSNIKAEQTYGFSREEFLKMNMNDIRAPYTKNEIEDTINMEVNESGYVFETRHLKKDGSEFYAELSTTPLFIDTERIYVHSVRDISIRKAAEKVIAASEKQYHSLIDFAPMTIFIQCDNKINYINPAGVKLFGAETPEQITNRSVFEFIHPDYHKIAAYRINLLREGMATPVIEEKIIRLDGQVLDVEVTAKPMKLSESPAIEVFMHDITIRKRSEIQSTFLAAIVESSKHPIIAISTEGVINYWNTGAEILYGYRGSEMERRRLLSIAGAEHHHNLISLFERAKHGEFIDGYKSKMKRKNGEYISVYLSLSPIRSAEGLIIGISVISQKNGHS
jgi:PAS domain S-box-containing protein